MRSFCFKIIIYQNNFPVHLRHSIVSALERKKSFHHYKTRNMNRERDMKALADTVFLEARGEIPLGQDSVAHVIMNRARRNKSYFGGRNVANVCYHPQQFECWNGRNTNLDISQFPRREQELYADIKKRTDAIYFGTGSSDPTNGSDHYHNPIKEPNNSWKDRITFMVRIGNHDFYKE